MLEPTPFGLDALDKFIQSVDVDAGPAKDCITNSTADSFQDWFFMLTPLSFIELFSCGENIECFRFPQIRK